MRFTANRLSVSGSIGADLVGAALRVALEPGIGGRQGDVVVWAFSLTAAGTIGSDLEGTQRSLDLARSVGGDVDVSVNRLVITGPLEVAGDFRLSLSLRAEGLDEANVGGVVAHKTPTTSEYSNLRSGIVDPIPGDPGSDLRRAPGRLGMAGTDRGRRRQGEDKRLEGPGSGALVILSRS